MESRILDHFGAHPRAALRHVELARAFGLDTSEARRELRHALRSLERQGKLVCGHRNRWQAPRADPARVKGWLRIVGRGQGVVTLDDRPGMEVAIPRSGLLDALDGDRVEVVLRPPRPPRTRHHGRGRGRPRPSGAEEPSGRVVRVLERTRRHLVGYLHRAARAWYLTPEDHRLNLEVRILGWPDGLDPRPGERYAARLEPDPGDGGMLAATLVEALPEGASPAASQQALLRRHDLESGFSPDLAEAAHAAAALRNDPGPREDFRELLTLTIDPADARDHDDAVSLEPLPDGNLRLGIHIADVSHYVRPGAPLDREARARGTTTYLVDRAVYMLPSELTRDVCSLVPGEDHLAYSALITLTPDGEVRKADMTPSVVRVTEKLAYEEVQAVMDGTPGGPPEGPVRDAILAMRPLAAALRRRRMRAGSIDFNMPELKIELDDRGEVVGLHRRHAEEAYHLIEEFMLAANQAVARFLRAKGVPSLYRVHPEPDEGQWARMQEQLADLGYGERPSDRAGMNRVAAKARGTPAEHVVNLALLRNLNRAYYAARCEEHFGLAFEAYTHFTSPIRRYPDLVVHRILRAVQTGASPPFSGRELAPVALHASVRERIAADAEAESVDLYRLHYFRERMKRGEVGPYEGVVTDLVPRGALVELTDSLLRGLIPFASAAAAPTSPRKRRRQRHHRHPGPRFRIGQPVRVNLARIDEARGWVDFDLAPGPRPKAG